MNEDVHIKRRKFIGKFHSLKQEFGFLSSDMFFDILNIYATSFYGSNLWLFSSPSTERLFTCNSMIRAIWKLPNTTHRYFIEEISKAQDLKASLFKRYLNFVKDIVKSEKKCLSALAFRVCHDQGSITRHNLNQIENESNCYEDILSSDAHFVSSQVKYAPVPDDEKWRISLLKELIGLRNHNFFLEDDQLTEEEIEDMILFVATS